MQSQQELITAIREADCELTRAFAAEPAGSLTNTIDQFRGVLALLLSKTAPLDLFEVTRMANDYAESWKALNRESVKGIPYPVPQRGIATAQWRNSFGVLAKAADAIIQF